MVVKGRQTELAGLVVEVGEEVEGRSPTVAHGDVDRAGAGESNRGAASALGIDPSTMVSRMKS